MKTKTLNSLIMAIVLLLPMLAHAQATYPEDGWWWDADASGRGYFIERQENTIFIAAFIYSETGIPEWLTAVGDYIPSNPETGSIGSITGNVYRNSNGQCIGCAYTQPTEVLSDQSKLSIDFSDNQNGLMEWAGESIPITRFFWSWEDAADQLTGTWLLTELENSETLGQLVSIERDDVTGNASITNVVSGAEVGAVELLDGDLVLTLSNASESELPLVMPESKRFYAGYGDSAALQVFALRLDDMPMGAITSAITTGGTAGVLCAYYDSTPNAQESVTITSISEWTCTDT